ncbi:MAG: LytTR family transcriptional regulator [Acidobacteria bacterium]|nr:LytTR family transcriptional regulator [Acidobacteriota bacterium]
MDWHTYEKQARFWECSFWILLASVHTLVDSLSVIEDYRRLGLEIETWQPFTWESSSQFMGLVLIPLVLWFDRRFPMHGNQIRKGLMAHLAFSVPFSILHVTGMVWIRKFVYLAMGGHYDFGHVLHEWVYEYRKDLISYAWLVGVIYAYRFMVSRLRGEAKVIETGEDTPSTKFTERFLVKKIGKEFIVKVQDIEWIEAAGNYMELHVGERVYPLRETMAGLEKKLDPDQFARIHRSYMVNLDAIQEIIPLDSGDSKVRLKNGQELNFSRRYREQMKGRLA